MTGVEIRQAAERLVDDTIDEPSALPALNECLLDFGDLALIYDSTTIAATTLTWYDLPATAITIAEIVDATGMTITKYKRRGMKVRFTDSGTYTIHYTRLPIKLSALTASPEPHELFHPAMVKYLAGWFKLRDDDENPDGLRLMSEYKNDVMRAANNIRRKRGPQTVTVVR